MKKLITIRRRFFALCASPTGYGGRFATDEPIKYLHNILAKGYLYSRDQLPEAVRILKAGHYWCTVGMMHGHKVIRVFIDTQRAGVISQERYPYMVNVVIFLDLDLVIFRFRKGLEMCKSPDTYACGMEAWAYKNKVVFLEAETDSMVLTKALPRFKSWSDAHHHQAKTNVFDVLYRAYARLNPVGKGGVVCKVK